MPTAIGGSGAPRMLASAFAKSPSKLNGTSSLRTPALESEEAMYLKLRFSSISGPTSATVVIAWSIRSNRRGVLQQALDEPHEATPEHSGAEDHANEVIRARAPGEEKE